MRPTLSNEALLKSQPLPRYAQSMSKEFICQKYAKNAKEIPR